MLVLLLLPIASALPDTFSNYTLTQPSPALAGFRQSITVFEQIEGFLGDVLGLGAEARGLGLVNTNTILTNIASSSTVLKVIIINLCHLLFNTVGWYLVSWGWSVIRYVDIMS